MIPVSCSFLSHLTLSFIVGLVDELQKKVSHYQTQCEQQESELKTMRTKYDEMYEYYTETEKVVTKRIEGIESNLHMKEEEVVRLKQILYNKEDVIRKISIAYEQAKNNLESYIDEIEYLNHRLTETDNREFNKLVYDNQNLRQQNKQLLTMLMNHLTKVNRSKSDRKKKKLENTLIK